VTARARRVAALAAVFAPKRAGTLLALLAGADAGGALADAVALAGASRRERLAALAAALSSDPVETGARAAAAAATERTRVAALLRALAAGDAVTPPASAAIVRLCREAIGR
jgi:hypothetical protein